MKCINCLVNIVHDVDDYCSNECFDEHQTELAIAAVAEVQELERMWHRE